MSYWGWRPYVPVVQRRAEAARAIEKARSAGQEFTPIVLASRTIASTFWGKAWCDNLKAYSDFANRLPRGGRYVRNGLVVDLKIEPGKVMARVLGTKLYRIEVGVTALPARRWKKLKDACAGSIDTLVELLQGKFSKAIMARLCEVPTGLFPSNKEIQMACSCPDWATMCKHVAAVLYGVGARLDKHPELLFVLRQVDPNDLLSVQAAALPARHGGPAKANILDDAELGDIFGIEMAQMHDPAKTVRARPNAASMRATKRSGSRAGTKTHATQAKLSVEKNVHKSRTKGKRDLKKSSKSSAAALPTATVDLRAKRSHKSK